MVEENNKQMGLMTELFGDCRDATKEEQEGVNKYIDSISTPTGITFNDSNSVNSPIRLNMNWDEAIKFCEDHECTECDVYLKNLDKRTKEEKENHHVPCVENLVDEKYKIRRSNI